MRAFILAIICLVCFTSAVSAERNVALRISLTRQRYCRTAGDPTLLLYLSLQFRNEGNSAIDVFGTTGVQKIIVARSAHNLAESKYELEITQDTMFMPEIGHAYPKRPMPRPRRLFPGHSWAATELIAIPVVMKSKGRVDALGLGKHYLRIRDGLTVAKLTDVDIDSVPMMFVVKDVPLEYCSMW